MSSEIPSPLRGLTQADLAAVAARERWLRQAYDPRRGGKQIPPPGDWLTLIYKAGRGYGKTKTEVEWGWNECWRVPSIILHAVGPTIGDMEGTLMEGPAGFRACIPAECLYGGSWEQAYNQSKHIVRLSNGSIVRGFGATDGGAKLRGPQCSAAIADELREWDKPAGMLAEAWSNMEFGVRLPYPDGTPSRIVAGTTPKAIPFLKNLYKAPGVIVVTGSSYENIHNLAESYKTRLFSKEGTQIGRVEIHAEDIDAEEGGIFKRSWFRLWPSGKKLPPFSKIVVVVDPAATEHDYNIEKQIRDPAGCAVFGVFNTAQQFKPEELKRMGVRSQYAALLCDLWLERLGFPDLCEKVRVTYRTKWGAQPSRRADLVLIESEKTGMALRQTLMQYGVPTWPFSPHGQSKTMRAHGASPMVLQGMLWVPESTMPDRKGQARNWAEPLIEQCTTFAGDGSIEHDECVDLTSMIMLHLMSEGVFHAEAMVRGHPDPDEAAERREKEAVLISQREKRGKHSPYGS